jgi:uncharacterized membrane protein required for colicin V production
VSVKSKTIYLAVGTACIIAAVLAALAVRSALRGDWLECGATAAGVAALAVSNLS